MALRMVGLNGYEVEAINLDGRQQFRISQHVAGHRILIAYVRTVAEVASHLDLADLVEVVQLPRPSPQASSAARAET